ncbi:MAG TPA: hypothetical protein VHC96_08475 [Puia sp.]|nr:hypothetical protein [Puia sp.]
MRRTLSLLLTLLTSQTLFAQTETQPADDMPFGLIMGIILLSVALACMTAGVIVSVVTLSITAAMAAAGVISAAVVVGLYKRSATAGFKTLLTLSSAIGGGITGITSLYLANKIFNLNLARATVAWAGLAGGLIGGILLSLILISIIRVIIGLFKERLFL